jgi:hypothetical protein
LAVEAYPKAEDLPGVLGFRRKWVLRLNANLPAGETLEDAVISLGLAARREISKALGGQGDFEHPLPAVSAVRLGDHHLILQIDCPSAAAEMGDAAAIATWVILRGADERWQLEDLQGIPKRYWFILS